MTDTLRGWKALADHYQRDSKTVRQWADNGCPHTKDGNVHIFVIEDVDAWLQSRTGVLASDSNLLEGASDDDRDALLKARIRKLQLESDALTRTKEKEEGLVAPVAEMEAAVTKLLFQLKQHMSEKFNELLESADLSASEKEKLNAEFIDGFNRIAELEPE